MSENGFDFAEVRRRLERAAAAIQQADQLSSERAAAILAQRASVLATVPTHISGGSETLRVVTFRVGPERFAVGADYVLEVVRPLEHTLVPGSPDLLIGVVNLRGTIQPVFDAARFLGLSGDENSPATRFLVLGEEQPEFGLRVDEVQEVTTLRLDEIHKIQGTALRIGVTAQAVTILDGAALLADDQLFIEVGS